MATFEMTQFTCFCCPGCPWLVSRAYSLQLAFPCHLPDEPLQPVSQAGYEDILPDIPQHFLQHQQRKDSDEFELKNLKSIRLEPHESNIHAKR